MVGENSKNKDDLLVIDFFKFMDKWWEEEGYRVEYEYRTVKTCGADLTFKVPKRIPIKKNK